MNSHLYWKKNLNLKLCKTKKKHIKQKKKGKKKRNAKIERKISKKEVKQKK